MAVTDVDLDTSGSSPSGSLSKSQMNLVFITVMLGMLLSALDQTIVSTALPTIVGDLGGAGHQSWVVTAYMLTETVATVRLIGQAWENWIMEQLADWLPAAGGDDARRARVQAAMKPIVARIIAEEERRVQDVRNQLNAA